MGQIHYNTRYQAFGLRRVAHSPDDDDAGHCQHHDLQADHDSTGVKAGRIRKIEERAF